MGRLRNFCAALMVSLGACPALADEAVAEIAGKVTFRDQGGEVVLTVPLCDGRLGSEEQPYDGAIALDGNLTEALLAKIAKSPLFAKSDLRVAPASPGKAERLHALLTAPNATIYVNLEEAGLLCKTRFDGAPEAAKALLDHGAAQVLVTDGGKAAAHATPQGIITAEPPHVLVTRVTGAGDTFMAAHIAAEVGGAAPSTALNHALRAAADYVSGDVPS